MNTPGFRLLGAYLTNFSTDYLRKALSGLVEEIALAKVGYEVDPDKLHTWERASDNMDNLITAAYKFFGCIVNSLSYCPTYVLPALFFPLPSPLFSFLISFRFSGFTMMNAALRFASSPIRQLCNLVHAQVEQRFGRADARAVVARFLFLRFFCPVIAYPQPYTIVPTSVEISSKAHRTFVVVGTILKHLASSSQFKEHHMSDMNSFLQKHYSLVQDFADKMAVRAFSQFHLSIATVMLLPPFSLVACPDFFFSSFLPGLS
jgi:hypothetical protein